MLAHFHLLACWCAVVELPLMSFLGWMVGIPFAQMNGLLVQPWWATHRGYDLGMLLSLGSADRSLPVQSWWATHWRCDFRMLLPWRSQHRSLLLKSWWATQRGFYLRMLLPWRSTDRRARGHGGSNSCQIYKWFDGFILGHFFHMFLKRKDSHNFTTLATVIHCRPLIMSKLAKLNKTCIYFLTKISNNLAWLQHITTVHNNVVYSFCSTTYNCMQLLLRVLCNKLYHYPIHLHIKLHESIFTGAVALCLWRPSSVVFFSYFLHVFLLFVIQINLYVNSQSLALFYKVKFNRRKRRLQQRNHNFI